MLHSIHSLSIPTTTVLNDNYSSYTKLYRHLHNNGLFTLCLLTTCLCGKAAVKANYVCPAIDYYVYTGMVQAHINVQLVMT